MIENTIEKIPGLSTLVEKIMDSINRLVFTTLEPLLKFVFFFFFFHARLYRD